MVDVPTPTPVTTPVPAITVATVSVELLHVPPAVASDKGIVNVWHTDVLPVIATGCVFTVTICVT